MGKINRDLRIIILEYINNIKHTTEEVSINEFLSTLKTYNGKEDIGTITRAIDDLKSDGYIRETRDISAYSKINTNGPVETAKNPIRFIKDIVKDGVVIFPKIPPIYLIITLKGKHFFLKDELLRRQTWLVRNDMWIKLLFGLVTFTLGLLSSFIIESAKEYKQLPIQEPQETQCKYSNDTEYENQDYDTIH